MDRRVRPCADDLHARLPVAPHTGDRGAEDALSLPVGGLQDDRARSVAEVVRVHAVAHADRVGILPEEHRNEERRDRLAADHDRSLVQAALEVEARDVERLDRSSAAGAELERRAAAEAERLLHERDDRR